MSETRNKIVLRGREFSWTVERKTVGWLVLGALSALLFWVGASAYLPPAIDWTDTFYPATREALSGHSPYTVKGFYYPPWTLVPLAPLGLFEEQAGRGGFFVLGLVCYGAVALHYKAKPLALGAYLLSPIVLHGLVNGNIDWIVMLGVLLPPRWGLFFAVVKPQVGAGLCLYWLIETFREGGWRKVFNTFWPVTVGLLASFALFGLWPLSSTKAVDFWWNASLWPWAIPLAVLLFIVSVRQRDERPAFAAAPFATPYVLFHSYCGALVVLSHRTRVMILIVLALWSLVILRAVTI